VHVDERVGSVGRVDVEAVVSHAARTRYLPAVLAFSKYEGLGNDFVIVDVDAWGSRPDRDAIAICDRFTGVGADGVLVVDDRTPSMRVINADGSSSEMCGNGLRCVVLHLARRARLGEQVAFTGPDVVVQTDAGPHPSVVVSSFDRGAEVEVHMRVPSLVPTDLPLVASAPLVDAPFVDGVRFTGVSMGNPHAVTFDVVDERARLALGPRVQSDPRFPEGVNVGFARPIDPRDDVRTFDLDVFERGSGWTRACGTGACAAAVAAVVTGRARRHEPVVMRLPGGPLTITVGADHEPVRMRGPARHVFDGVLDASFS
jgi:diaminopimelate epimerase